MFKYIIENAGNFDWIAIATTIVFFMVFIANTIWILTKNKGYIDKMANMPLDENLTQNAEK
jgi:cbb3-type cytochrome oxidase subunit 3